MLNTGVIIRYSRLIPPQEFCRFKARDIGYFDKFLVSRMHFGSLTAFLEFQARTHFP
jgi:hypothetical protein